MYVGLKTCFEMVYLHISLGSLFQLLLIKLHNKAIEKI